MRKEKLAQILPILCVVTGNVIWGFSFLFTKVAISRTDPNVMLGHRFTLAVLIMAGMLLTGREKFSGRGKNWWPLIVQMVFQQVYFVTESYGILYTNATIAGLVLAVVPVVSIGTGALFLREYPTRRQALFCILPVAGVIMMTVSGSELGIVRPLGLVLLTGTCLSTAIYRTANRWAAREFSPFERTFMVVASSAVFFTATGLRSVGWSLEAYLEPLRELPYLASVLSLSVLCSIVADILVNYATGRMSVFKISAFGALCTLSSTFAGVVLLREPINLTLLLGAVLILVGIRQVVKK